MQVQNFPKKQALSYWRKCKINYSEKLLGARRDTFGKLETPTREEQAGEVDCCTVAKESNMTVRDSKICLHFLALGCSPAGKLELGAILEMARIF